MMTPESKGEVMASASTESLKILEYCSLTW